MRSRLLLEPGNLKQFKIRVNPANAQVKYSSCLVPVDKKISNHLSAVEPQWCVWALVGVTRSREM